MVPGYAARRDRAAHLRHDFGPPEENRFPRRGVLFDAVWTCRRCGYVLRRPYKIFARPTSNPGSYVAPSRRDCGTELAKSVMDS